MIFINLNGYIVEKLNKHSKKLLSRLIRTEFDNTENEIIIQECITSANEIGLIDLAKEMQVDYDFEYNKEQIDIIKHVI